VASLFVAHPPCFHGFGQMGPPFPASPGLPREMVRELCEQTECHDEKADDQHDECNADGLPVTWCQPLLSLINKDRQKLFLSPSSRPAHQRSCQIPVCYDLRCCPREHLGWNVPSVDQQ